MIESNKSALDWLQRYYSACCDGDWEHSYGIKIETLDNPGWYVEIDLSDTPMEHAEFSEVKFEVSSTNWLSCRVEGNVFKAAGGPLNLNDAIKVFQQWHDASRNTSKTRT